MAKGIKVRGTEATIYQPTETHRWWKVAYIDRATGKRRTTSGGHTQEEAETKARRLSGQYVEGWKSGGIAPTLQEAVDLWLAANRSNWSSRTYDHYSYFAQKFTALYGTRPIDRITPIDISKVDLTGQSRGQQEKARTLLRGILGHSSAWMPDKKIIENIVRGITLSGNSGGKRNPRVSRGDIPSSQYIAATIITAYHTLQLGPFNDPEWSSIDAVSGKKRRRTGSMKLHPALGMATPLDDAFKDGLTLEIANSHRRGIPKHYSNPDDRRKDETLELAARYRQIGLATALGAGGGLRIGEVLALRVRHFLSPTQVALIGSKDWRLGADYYGGNPELAFRGVLDVSEQASQASRGKVWITGTKGNTKSRTVHLPAFLPNWNGFGISTHRPQIASVIPRFADPAVSLWDATEEEALTLWKHGFTPLGFLVWQRLHELWQHPAIKHLPLGPRAKEYRQLLLFPTRNKARKGRDGLPNVQTDPGWRKSIRIVEGDGTYQAQSNYATHTNPLYDYVEEQFDESPEHRTNAEGRKGWTHHGFRHWAVSSRIQAGVPLPLIAKEMGHSDSAFTLERYGHVLDQGVADEGFEY